MASALRLKHIFRGALLFTALVAAYCGVLRITGNFHAVIPNQLYRSAQPAPRELRDYIRNFGIKTVINLRGSNPKREWYRKEVAVTEEMGVAHIDFGMSALQIFSPARTQELIAIMRTAKKPILVHCEGGADRSGLVAAIYVSAVAHGGERAAEKQISIRYGHIGIPYLAPAYAIDESWERLEPLFGFNGS